MTTSPTSLTGPLAVGNLYVANTTASTSTTTGAIVTAGGVGVAGNLYLGGNLVTSGTVGNISGVNVISTITVNNSGNISVGTSTVFPGSRIQVVGGNVNVATTGTGIVFPDGTFMTTANGYSNVQTAGYLSGPVMIGNLYVANTTASTSTITGAIVTSGGLGVAGNIYVGGNVTISSNLFVTSSGGTSLFSGNVGIGTSSNAQIFRGNTMTVFGNVNVISGSLLFNGVAQGAGISGITITNDTSTNATTFYPSMTNNTTSGSITGLTTSSTKLYFNPSTGTLNSTAFNSLSDITMKTNIQQIPTGLGVINKLRGVGFDWKETGKKSFGVIAQEIEKIIPEVVDLNDDLDVKTVNYLAIIGFLIEAVKELDAKIDVMNKSKSKKGSN
jgi:hypothetical protein